MSKAPAHAKAEPGTLGLAIEPARDAFARAYAEGRAQVVSTRLVADLETPVSAMLKLSHDRPMSFLLESVEGGAVRGRYSVIGLAPDIIWRASGAKAEINRTAQSAPDAFVPEPDAPLASLRKLLDASRIALPRDIPHIGASVIGYMGYDMVRLAEHLPAVPPDSLGVPDSIFVRPTITVVFDSVKDEMIVIAPVWPDAAQSADAAYTAAVARLESVVTGLDEPVPHASIAPDDALATPEAVSNTTKDEFFAKVARAKEYIAAGDVFQVIVGQRFSAPFTLPSLALYRALRRTNPSPFLFHLDFGSFALVGSSPEILVRVREGEVTIRPLAGTIRRGATPEEDKELEAKLLADPKERAEHLMLVDLGRNDVGRVSEIGSVRVRESFVIERYSHVMHISSHVTGKLDTRHDVIDALMAGFPAGTLSGAPKVRAMQIIDELEKEKRGPYGGCVGYFSADGEMDSCIVLRTALVKDGRIYVQAGAGIVADSDPAAEQAECEAKSRALFKAAEEAVRFAKASRRGNR
ncbi:MAG: anthranilate synthase component I [Hyphomicrobiales bacterium]|nr:MAG: anthranilate synthase component I [Hyphomicrobiales bacterium]